MAESVWGVDHGDVSKSMKDLPFKAKGFMAGMKTGAMARGGSNSRWKDPRWNKPYAAGEKVAAPFKRGADKIRVRRINRAEMRGRQ